MTNEEPQLDPKIQARLEKLEALEKKFNAIWTRTVLVIFGAIAIVAVWIWVPFWMYNKVRAQFPVVESADGTKSGIPSDLGLVGDLFGSVNALFAGFAFLFLTYSIFQAHKSNKQNAAAIDMQREELAMQRREMQESREALETQASAQIQLNGAIIALAHEIRTSSLLSVQTAIATAKPETQHQRDRIMVLVEYLQGMIQDLDADVRANLMKYAPDMGPETSDSEPSPPDGSEGENP